MLNFKMVAPKPRSVTPIIAWIRDFLGQVNPFLINAILVDSYDVSHYAEVSISWILFAVLQSILLDRCNLDRTRR